MMQFNEFMRHLRQASVAPVYLFSGEADRLMEDAWKLLVERIVPAGARHFNGERLTAKEQSVDQVLARLGTLSMFGPRRLLMVQRMEIWPKDQRNQLLAYLGNPFPSACLVLTTSLKKGMEKLESAVESVGAVVRFPLPMEREVPRWVQERAKSLNKFLDPRAAALLIELVGVELHRLERELDKLVAYVGDRERIETGDVTQTVSSQRSFSVFELLDFVSLHQDSQAVSALRSLILAGEPLLVILALMARQVRIVWQIKDGLERGLTAAQIGPKLGLSSFVVKKYLQQASSFSQPELHGIHQAICDADVALKSTSVAPEWVMEALVLSLCHKKQKGP
jgi:DNA polymerase-3 subunit delta